MELKLGKRVVFCGGTDVWVIDQLELPLRVHMHLEKSPKPIYAIAAPDEIEPAPQHETSSPDIAAMTAEIAQLRKFRDAVVNSEDKYLLVMWVPGHPNYIKRSDDLRSLSQEVEHHADGMCEAGISTVYVRLD